MMARGIIKNINLDDFDYFQLISQRESMGYLFVGMFSFCEFPNFNNFHTMPTSAKC